MRLISDIGGSICKEMDSKLEVNHYTKRVDVELKALEEAIARLDKAKPGEAKDIIKVAEAEERKADGDMKSLSQAALELASEADKADIRVKIEQFKERHTRLKIELEFKRKAKNSADLYGNSGVDGPQRGPPGSPNEGNGLVQQYINRGDYAYQGAISAMERGLVMVENSKQVAGAVENELQEQDGQIGRIHDKTEDIRSNLKLANKIMNYIHRRFLTDKLILCLIIAIVIVIIFLIIYGAAGLDSNDNFNTPDDQT
mmetsp:Transcript_32547/g.56293  ORF Transcript_32547/g.56293 Transcript_32547/m.56293 type:complete len:257 (+) Transcript_32547:1906-2676(+)